MPGNSICPLLSVMRVGDAFSRSLGLISFLPTRTFLFCSRFRRKRPKVRTKLSITIGIPIVVSPFSLYDATNITRGVGHIVSIDSSRTTHGACTCVDACRYMGGIIAGALNGVGKDDLLSDHYAPMPGFWCEFPLCPEINEIAAGSFKRKNPPEIKGTGHVVRSLEAALWAFHKGNDFREGALLAVNLGDDADTTGAVYGQIAGAYYGYEAIPANWRNMVAMKDVIVELAPHQRATAWYFLHMVGKGPPRGPTVSYRDTDTGQVVVSIPAMTIDPFWDTQRPMSNTRLVARSTAIKGVEMLLSADGRQGRIPEVIQQGVPVTILTHWQSLYSDGSCAGLRGLAVLLKRLRKVYGDNLLWSTCSALARQTSDDVKV